VSRMSLSTAAASAPRTHPPREERRHVGGIVAAGRAASERDSPRLCQLREAHTRKSAQGGRGGGNRPLPHACALGPLQHACAVDDKSVALRVDNGSD
jgi:hypothetical protein